MRSSLCSTTPFNRSGKDSGRPAKPTDNAAASLSGNAGQVGDWPAFAIIQTLTIRSSRFCYCPAVTQSDIDQQRSAGFDRDAVDCLWAGVILGELAGAVRACFLLGPGPGFA